MQNNVVLHVRARISATSMSSRPVANPSQSCRNAEARYRSTSFFSSSLADVALRLGPYMSISCQRDICTRTQLVHKYRQIKQTKKHRTNNHDDPQIPQPDLRFVKRKQQTRQKRGKAQTNNNHKEDLPNDTADSPLCHYTKACKMNYPPRHSVKREDRSKNEWLQYQEWKTVH